MIKGEFYFKLISFVHVACGTFIKLKFNVVHVELGGRKSLFWFQMYLQNASRRSLEFLLTFAIRDFINEFLSPELYTARSPHLSYN